MMLLLASCATSGQGDECLLFDPIYLNQGDTIAAETARQILNHNRTWEKLCGEPVRRSEA
jgi:hypothetical protein